MSDEENLPVIIEAPEPAPAEVKTESIPPKPMEPIFERTVLAENLRTEKKTSEVLPVAPTEILRWSWAGVIEVLNSSGDHNICIDNSAPVLVSSLQRFLNSNGYAVGSATGAISAKTVSGIQSWLNDEGYSAGDVDGVPGPKTKAAWDQL